VGWWVRVLACRLVGWFTEQRGELFFRLTATLISVTSHAIEQEGVETGD
jgi:hypothetical protein